MRLGRESIVIVLADNDLPRLLIDAPASEREGLQRPQSGKEHQTQSRGDLNT